MNRSENEYLHNLLLTGERELNEYKNSSRSKKERAYIDLVDMFNISLMFGKNRTIE